jgi:hypothetical protein
MISCEAQIIGSSRYQICNLAPEVVHGIAALGDPFAGRSRRDAPAGLLPNP